jgi:hypothetical protein
MKITKRQLRRIIKEEKAKLSRNRLLRETFTGDNVLEELINADAIIERLLLALDNGGIEAETSLGGLNMGDQEAMRTPLENIRHELLGIIDHLG